MKSRFFSLIIAAICSFSALSAQAQAPIKIQSPKIQNVQSVKQPSGFILSHLSLSSFEQQKSLSSRVEFWETPALFNNSTPKPSFFQPEKPLNIYSVSIPALGIGYGFIALHPDKLKMLNLSTKNEIREDHPYFRTHIDNYLQWSPAAAVIGLNLAGIRGRNQFGDALAVYGVSTVLMAGSVFSLKKITHEQRPDGSNFYSFPSGHTATAFAAAEWLRMEYGYTHPWIAVAGYAAATTTGVLRIYNNRHWVSDVIAGAALGFLCTRVAYAINPWIKAHIFHTSKRGPLALKY